MTILAAIGKRLNETNQTIGIRELSDIEQDSLNCARCNIALLENLVNSRYILENNFQEFLNYAKYIKDSKDIITNNIGIQNCMTEIIHETNRLLINVLFAMTATVEHFKHHLKEMDREDYNTTVKNLFDSSPEYSFCYKLRNFSQHQCLPITDMNISSSIYKESDLNIYVNKDALLTYDSWGKIVRPYIESQDDKFEINNIIGKAISDLQEQIFLLWINKYVSSAESDIKIINDYILEIMHYCLKNNFIDAHPCLLENILPLNEKSTNLRISISHFPLIFLNKIGVVKANYSLRDIEG